MKRTIVALSVVALSALSVHQAGAFWPFDGMSNTSTTSTPALLDQIIAKFNLNKDEVQKVVTDYRTERQAEMQKAFEDRLTAAVKAGELTEAKKQLILQKHTELRGQREALQKWASDNDIDMSYFGNGGMGRGKGGMMGSRGMGRNW